VKKGKKLHVTKELPIYRIGITYTNSLDEYNRLVKLRGGQQVMNAGSTYQEVTETGQILILIGVFDKSVNTFAHECFHATMFVAYHLGLDVNLETHNEHLAYINGHLFEMFFDEFRSSQG